MTKSHDILSFARGHDRADRAVAALDQLTRRSLGEGGPAAIEKETLSAYAQRFIRGDDPGTGDSLNSPLNPFQKSLWVYRCVTKIATAAAGIPVRLSRDSAVEGSTDRRGAARRKAFPGRRSVFVGKTEGDVVETGAAADVLRRPNGYQTWPQFMTAAVGYLYLRGKVAWVLTGMVGRRFAEMHVLDGRTIKPVWGKDESQMPWLIGYEYRPPKTGTPIHLAPDEVKYFSLWSDGEDPLGGMSPLEPGRLAVATDYNASYFNASTLKNGAEPGIVINFPQTLTPEQREEYRAVYLQRHQGASAAKRPLILEGGATAAPFGTSMADLQFDQGKKTTRLEICCLFGVPPVVAGWVDAAGDSSAYTENALRQFYDGTVFPLLDSFAPALQELVSRLDRVEAWFDVEDQPIVQAMRLSRLVSARQLFDMGYPPNAINAALDLGMPEVPWGEVGYLAAGLLPAPEVAAAGAVAPEGEPPPAEEAKGKPQTPTGKRQTANGNQKSEASRARIWDAFARSYEALARLASKVLRVQAARDQEAVLKALKSALSAAGYEAQRAESSAPPSPSIAAEPLRRASEGGLPGGNPKSQYDGVLSRVLFDVFEDPKRREAFRARLRSVQADGQELGLRQALAEAGLSGTALEQAMKRILANPRINAALATESVMVSSRLTAAARAALKTSLAEGLDAGETIGELAERVQAVMGNSRRASLAVARNAVGQTLSRARHEGHVATGATHKVWVHSRGPGVRRPEHVAAEAYYDANPVPIAEPFIIDGASLQYPRDFASGRPDQTMNCQCLAIARRFAPGEEPVAAAFTPPETFLAYENLEAARATGRETADAV